MKVFICLVVILLQGLSNYLSGQQLIQGVKIIPEQIVFKELVFPEFLTLHLVNDDKLVSVVSGPGDSGYNLLVWNKGAKEFSKILFPGKFYLRDYSRISNRNFLVCGEVGERNGSIFNVFIENSEVTYSQVFFPFPIYSILVESDSLCVIGTDNAVIRVNYQSGEVFERQVFNTFVWDLVKVDKRIFFYTNSNYILGSRDLLGHLVEPDSIWNGVHSSYIFIDTLVFFDGRYGLNHEVLPFSVETFRRLNLGEDSLRIDPTYISYWSKDFPGVFLYQLDYHFYQYNLKSGFKEGAWKITADLPSNEWYILDWPNFFSSVFEGKNVLYFLIRSGFVARVNKYDIPYYKN